MLYIIKHFPFWRSVQFPSHYNNNANLERDLFFSAVMWEKNLDNTTLPTVGRADCVVCAGNGAWLLKWDPWKNRPNPITTIGRRNKISNQRRRAHAARKNNPVGGKVSRDIRIKRFRARWDDCCGKKGTGQPNSNRIHNTHTMTDSATVLNG